MTYVRAWWLVPELVAVLVLGGLAGVSLAGRASPDPDLRAELATRVVAALEQASPAEHHDHGHDIGTGHRVACVAEIYGTDPAEATRVAQVRTVYAHYLCAAGAPGTPFEASTRISGPVAVGLGAVPVVRIAQSGAGYPERVRALLPDRYEEQALKGFSDPAVPAALRARYAARAAATA